MLVSSKHCLLSTTRSLPSSDLQVGLVFSSLLDIWKQAHLEV